MCIGKQKLSRRGTSDQADHDRQTAEEQCYNTDMELEKCMGSEQVLCCICKTGSSQRMSDGVAWRGSRDRTARGRGVAGSSYDIPTTRTHNAYSSHSTENGNLSSSLLVSCSVMFVQ